MIAVDVCPMFVCLDKVLLVDVAIENSFFVDKVMGIAVVDEFILYNKSVVVVDAADVAVSPVVGKIALVVSPIVVVAVVDGGVGGGVVVDCAPKWPIFYCLYIISIVQ